jgi:N-acyl-D-amino-acid deacylase
MNRHFWKWQKNVGAVMASSKFDLIVRNGTVVDGSGNAARVADIGVKNGVITEVGIVAGSAQRTIDAKGLLVTPGFVDIHTHYDGQALWSQRLNPSSAHGVTTVVTGNCGVGFAPCRKEDRQNLIDMMVGVEDIPEIVLADGIPWNWETFVEYMDAVDNVPHDIDIAVFVPHSPLRVYVMGARALAREAATSDDMARMRQLLDEAMGAGAIGFATSRLIFHRNKQGELIPSYGASWGELEEIGKALGERGHGVIQIANIPNDEDIDVELERMAHLSKVTGRPTMVVNVQQSQDSGGLTKFCRKLYNINARKEGRLILQMFPRPAGIIIGLSSTTNPFMFCPSYSKIAHLPLDQKVAELRKPEIRKLLLAEGEVQHSKLPMARMVRDFDRMYALGKIPNYEPDYSESVASRAVRAGVSSSEMAYDMLLEGEGKLLYMIATINYADHNLNFLETLLVREDVVLGLGDGGAHYGFISDCNYTTFMLKHWVTERSGKHFSLPEVVAMLTRKTAEAVGLNDRGLIAEGYKADLNIIDYDNLNLYQPYVVRDLPKGALRIEQDASGYVATIVSGQVIAENGVPTDCRPGRLVRNAASS